MCSAFRGKADRSPNLTIKKIPKAVLSRCEWGKDDYSLQVENLPKAPPPKGQIDLLSGLSAETPSTLKEGMTSTGESGKIVTNGERL